MIQKENPNKTREYYRAWRKKNKEHCSEYDREYYAARADKIREYKRAYRAANLEKLREQARVRRAANKEKFVEQDRIWRAANLERIRVRDRARHAANPYVSRSKDAKRRASVKTSVGKAPTPKQLADLMKDPCVYCGDPSEHADHVIPIARGGDHTIDNLVPSCAKCNYSKGSKLPVFEWNGRIDRHK